MAKREIVVTAACLSPYTVELQYGFGWIGPEMWVEWSEINDPTSFEPKPTIPVFKASEG